jgi:hypothetical protein
MSGSALPNTFRLIICRGCSVHLILRPASLLPALAQAFDAPLWPVGSLRSAGACYRVLWRLPGRDFHPREVRVFQDAPWLNHTPPELFRAHRACAETRILVKRTSESFFTPPLLSVRLRYDAPLFDAIVFAAVCCGFIPPEHEYGHVFCCRQAVVGGETEKFSRRARDLR